MGALAVSPSNARINQIGMERVFLFKKDRPLLTLVRNFSSIFSFETTEEQLE